MENKNIGILDPHGLELNPLNNKSYSDQYKLLSEKWSNFPAYESAKDIIKTIEENQVILVISGTGSGKTVLIPKFALHTTNYTGHVAITLPKQIIAKSAAEFAAATLDVNIGEQVGYKYKGSEPSHVGVNPNLLYATDGTIVAKLLNDSTLKDLDIVIIDEAHERKIQIDFLLYLLKKTLTQRPSFKLIIMSATIDSSIFNSYFAEFKFAEINVGGKTNYPIESIFSNDNSNSRQYINRGLKIIDEIESLYTPTNSKVEDILFFVCSRNETEEVKELLEKKYKYEVIAVYSGISADKQERLQNKTINDRRIIISTNVAESSLTVDGIRFVIDSGFEIYSYDEAKTGAKVIEKQLITKAQAMQRMGRAGRTQPGICYHLYTRDEFENKMKKFPEPSIRTTDITTECIRLLAENAIKTIEELLRILAQFIEPPREEYIKLAMKNIKMYNLLKDYTLNDFGQFIGELQLNMNEALTLYFAFSLNVFNETMMIILLINEIKSNINELFIIPEDNQILKKKFQDAKKDLISKYGDHIMLHKIIDRFRLYETDSGKDNFCYKYFLKKSLLAKVVDNYSRINYRIKDKFIKIKNKFENNFKNNNEIVDKKEKIIASFLFGYKYNISIKNKTINKINVKIGEESAMYKSSHTKFFYNDLYKINGEYEIKIVSFIPDKIIKLI